MDCRKTKIDVFAYVNSNKVSVFSKCLLKLITIFLHLHESIIFSSRHLDLLYPVRIARPLGTSFSLHNFYFRRGQTFVVGVHKLLPWMFTNFCRGCSQTFAVGDHKLLSWVFTNFCRGCSQTFVVGVHKLLPWVFTNFCRGCSQTFALDVHKLLPWMFTNFCCGCSQTFAVDVHKLLPWMFTNFCRDVDTSYCCRCLQELLPYIFNRCR